MAPPPGPQGLQSYTGKEFGSVAPASRRGGGNGKDGAPEKSGNTSAIFLVALWALFVLNRAVHPLAIDYSKEVTSRSLLDDSDSLKVGARVCLKGVGARYEGQRHLADVMQVSKDSVKVQYAGGGYKRFPREVFQELLTEMPRAGPDLHYELGMQVRLKGTGDRYRGRHFYADVEDITRTTVKVKYSDGGWRRYPKREFEQLLTHIPDARDGQYEEGMHVRLQGTGKWYSGKAFFVDIVDVTPETVKVKYADGGYKRMKKEFFEELLARQPDDDGEVVRELRYRKMTPVLMKTILSLFVCNLIALFDREGWREGLKRCYTGPSMRAFTFIGVIYALGDFLEMTSMGGMDGAMYQVLLQSKLVITAIMMWVIKGLPAKQTRTQWAALVTVTLGMIVFMTTTSSSSGSSKQSAGGAGIFAVSMVLLKVLVSCYAAVKSDQSLKQYANLPLYVQLSQLFLAWGVASLALAIVFEPASVLSVKAFFHGWNMGTWLVTMSFAVKTVLTMTLLKILDSIAKNIGEAVAVLAIYMMQILLPSFSQTFEIGTFFAISIVIMAVTTYMFLKHDLDIMKKATAAAKKADSPAV